MISIVVISKDEPALADTLAALGARDDGLAAEVVVVDASAGRLSDIRDRNPDVHWIDFERPEGVRISIPHQRNAGVAGAAGDVIVFTDAGCLPREGWLPALVGPILAGEEDVVSGVARTPDGAVGLYDTQIEAGAAATYLSEFPTINVALRREVFDRVGGFDETFSYGSDIDFSWRVAGDGVQIRSAPGAVVEHDWGTPKRQLKRAYLYGRARARLYRKHSNRLRTVWRTDPMLLAYPAFLLGLPLVAVAPFYPLLLVVPLWRSRHHYPMRTLADHLIFGAGILREVSTWRR